MARDITFRFRQQGLNDIRSEIQQTVRFIAKIREQLQKSNAPAPAQFRAGQEISRLDSILRASTKRYDELTASLQRTKQAQLLLTQEQQKATRTGRPVPAQLRGPGGKFTGQTQQSLQADEAKILAQIEQENLATLGKVRSARARLLDITKNQVDQMQIIRQLNQQDAAAASGRGPGLTGFRMSQQPATSPESVATFGTESLIVTYDRLFTAINRLREAQAHFDSDLAASSVYERRIAGMEKQRSSLQETAVQVEALRVKYLAAAEAIDRLDKRVREGKVSAETGRAGIRDDDGKMRQLSREDAVNRAKEIGVDLTRMSTRALKEASVASREFGVSSESSINKYLAAIRAALDATRIGSGVKAVGVTLNKAVDDRIRLLQQRTDEGSNVLGNVRQQLRQDYPKETGDQVFKDFERAGVAVGNLNDKLSENSALLDELRAKSAKTRAAGTRELLGISAADAAPGKQTTDTEGDIKNSARINALLTWSESWWY